ncbi:MAG: hypothetical protein ABSA70_15720 [Terriglobia bacterium]
MLIPTVLVVIGAIDLFPFGVLTAAAFAWYCKWLLSGLNEKRGLAGAVGAGVATICLGLTFSGLIVGLNEEVGWLEQALRGLLVLAPATLVASAIGTYFGLRPERRDLGAWLAGLGLGVVYFCIVFISFGSYAGTLQRSRQAANHAWAVGSIRTINSCAAAYQSKYPDRGFPPNLTAMGTAGEKCLDGPLAEGRKSGYSFAYTPGAPNAKGRIESYTLAARPTAYAKTGVDSYFSDESQVIRLTQEQRPASPTDPPLQNL